MSLGEKANDLLLKASGMFYEAKTILAHAQYITDYVSDTEGREGLAEHRINLCAADLHEVARLCTQAAEILNAFNERINQQRRVA